MYLIAVGALLVGLTLGLMGSGGSILTVPVLAYVLGHEEKVAVAESLAIVGVIAALAAMPYAWSRQVDWRSVLWFGLPGMLGAYLGAWLAQFVSGAFQLVVFAIVMLVAARLMFRKAPHDETPEAPEGRTPGLKMLGEGLMVGAVTGMVGVGGGFLIVPALALLNRLPMRLAVGTSLVVISLKSATGLLKHLDVLQQLGASIDWPTVVVFSLIGAIGSLVGRGLSGFLEPTTLRRAFASFLVIMGLFVLFREVPKVLKVSGNAIGRPPDSPRVASRIEVVTRNVYLAKRRK